MVDISTRDVRLGKAIMGDCMPSIYAIDDDTAVDSTPDSTTTKDTSLGDTTSGDHPIDRRP